RDPRGDFAKLAERELSRSDRRAQPTGDACVAPANFEDLRRGEALPRPSFSTHGVVAGRRMRRPTNFEDLRRGEALPRPLSARMAGVAGRRMRRPTNFEDLRRGEAFRRPL